MNSLDDEDIHNEFTQKRIQDTIFGEGLIKEEDCPCSECVREFTALAKPKSLIEKALARSKQSVANMLGSVRLGYTESTCLAGVCNCGKCKE